MAGYGVFSLTESGVALSPRSDSIHLLCGIVGGVKGSLSILHPKSCFRNWIVSFPTLLNSSALANGIAMLLGNDPQKVDLDDDIFSNLTVRCFSSKYAWF